MGYQIEWQGKDGLHLTQSEMESNASTLIIAGSETTATLLSGATYYLLRNPETMTKVVKEVRETFETEEDINFASASRLNYMLAVLNESLRIYPPVPAGIPRVIEDQGAMIAGRWVPPHVRP
jgi:cytochrome P450